MAETGLINIPSFPPLLLGKRSVADKPQPALIGQQVEGTVIGPILSGIKCAVSDSTLTIEWASIRRVCGLSLAYGVAPFFLS